MASPVVFQLVRNPCQFLSFCTDVFRWANGSASKLPGSETDGVWSCWCCCGKGKVLAAPWWPAEHPCVPHPLHRRRTLGVSTVPGGSSRQRACHMNPSRSIIPVSLTKRTNSLFPPLRTVPNTRSRCRLSQGHVFFFSVCQQQGRGVRCPWWCCAVGSRRHHQHHHRCSHLCLPRFCPRAVLPFFTARLCSEPG